MLLHPLSPRFAAGRRLRADSLPSTGHLLTRADSQWFYRAHGTCAFGQRDECTLAIRGGIQPLRAVRPEAGVCGRRPPARRHPHQDPNYCRPRFAYVQVRLPSGDHPLRQRVRRRPGSGTRRHRGGTGARGRRRDDGHDARGGRPGPRGTGRPTGRRLRGDNAGQAHRHRNRGGRATRGMAVLRPSTSSGMR